MSTAQIQHLEALLGRIQKTREIPRGASAVAVNGGADPVPYSRHSDSPPTAEVPDFSAEPEGPPAQRTFVGAGPAAPPPDVGFAPAGTPKTSEPAAAPLELTRRVESPAPVEDDEPDLLIEDDGPDLEIDEDDSVEIIVEGGDDSAETPLAASSISEAISSAAGAPAMDVPPPAEEPSAPVIELPDEEQSLQEDVAAARAPVDELDDLPGGPSASPVVHPAAEPEPVAAEEPARPEPIVAKPAAAAEPAAADLGDTPLVAEPVSQPIGAEPIDAATPVGQPARVAGAAAKVGAAATFGELIALSLALRPRD